jgi:uncharacterized protein YdeI (YjbR/CyaY-like superfamily)
MKVISHKDLPIYSFKTPDEFHQWLSKNHTREMAFWLRYYKKGSGKPTILPSQAVDEALCWGWIDGLVNKYDDESWLVRFTPRRPKSVWSKVNVSKVERLVSEKRMQPCGQKHVDTAKADGRWEAAYAGQAAITVPDEFISLVKTDKLAWEFYQSLSKANKYAIAFRIVTTVDKDKKRQKMQRIFEMLQSKKSFH